MERGAFTLVELLVTVGVIGMVATLVVGALQYARTEARIARTKATIAKLDSIISRRYDSYLTRRVPVDLSGLTPQQAARVRLDAIRDLMRMEMPERWNDVTDPPYEFNWGSIPPPALNIVYGAQYQAALSRAGSALVGQNSHAECLYLIVASNPEDLEQFGEGEIGDTDGDGLLEFLDGWGRPIYFLRWAPGFSYRLGGLSQIQSGDPNADHDPFDVQRLEGGAFHMYPLIYSAGRDKRYGINTGQNVQFKGDPYANPAIGGPAPEEPGAWFDNIHNHMIEAQ
jgi:prepilin-type N-terminal cleavage/methylation domain-containing protein